MTNRHDISRVMGRDKELYLTFFRSFESMDWRFSFVERSASSCK